MRNDQGVDHNPAGTRAITVAILYYVAFDFF